VGIDSGSEDDSISILHRYGVRVIQIPPAEFQHGATRNLGAEGITSDVIVFHNQDALPGDRFFLKTMMDELAGDERCAGVCATIMPRSDCDPLMARDVLSSSGLMCGWRFTGVRDERRLVNPRHFHTVSCAIRTDVFRKIPFQDVAFGEDYLWNCDVQKAGWRTRLSSAVVEHSHPLFPHSISIMRIHADSTYFHSRFEKQTLSHIIYWLSAGIILDILFTASKRDLGVWQKVRWMLTSPYARGLEFIGRLAGKYHDYLPGNIRKKLFFYFR
jgi:rhamnosyltransferase